MQVSLDSRIFRQSPWRSLANFHAFSRPRQEPLFIAFHHHFRHLALLEHLELDNLVIAPCIIAQPLTSRITDPIFGLIPLSMSTFSALVPNSDPCPQPSDSLPFLPSAFFISDIPTLSFRPSYLVPVAIGFGLSKSLVILGLPRLWSRLTPRLVSTLVMAGVAHSHEFM